MALNAELEKKNEGSECQTEYVTLNVKIKKMVALNAQTEKRWWL